MEITFITGNAGKLQEIRTLLPYVKGRDLDLVEIQELDPHKIIRAKLAEAQKNQAGALLVEDTSLSLDTLNGLPGPLIKWFLKAVGVEGVYQLTQASQSRSATARTLLGYAEESGEVHFFEGVVPGELVPPRGIHGFGWDSIFQPNGSEKTFAEMEPAEKNRFSMRRLAVVRLQQHLTRTER